MSPSRSSNAPALYLHDDAPGPDEAPERPHLRAVPPYETGALRVLPPDATDHVITWATRLRDLANGKNVDWSDTWTEEDLADLLREVTSGDISCWLLAWLPLLQGGAEAGIIKGWKREALREPKGDSAATKRQLARSASPLAW